MRKRLLAAALLVGSVPIASPAAPPATGRAAAASATALIETDRRFSARSARAPGLEALTRMFADDVVIFAVPVPGFAAGRSAAAATLERAIAEPLAVTRWTPVRAGISADGSHGFTFGYMTSVVDGKPPLLAKYLAYWVRTRAGWRVKLFKRVPRPAGDVSLALMPPSLPLTLRRARGRHDAYEQSLREREQAFSDAAQKMGLGAAFARFGAPDSVNMGGEASFVVGAAEIAKVQPPTSPVRWSADQGVLVAPSGDLGVTWGYLRRNGPTPPGRLAQIPFFTVWRRANPEDPWYYVAE